MYSQILSPIMSNLRLDGLLVITLKALSFITCGDEAEKSNFMS